MKMHRNARGITLIGFAIVLGVLGFFAYLAMRLVPVYVEYFGVVKSMEQERIEPGAAAKTLDQVRHELGFKFNTQYVDEMNVPPTAITLKREAGAATMRVAYERRVPFIYNLELVATFDKSMSLTNVGVD